MISKDVLHIDWITEVSRTNRKADKILVEKVVRAFLLLEGLAQSGLPFIFKGGTAVMLLQKAARRFSIDIDILVEAQAGLEAGLRAFTTRQGFTRYALQDRKKNPTLEKLHYKFFYTPVHRTQMPEDHVLLDIVVEPSKYHTVNSVEIVSSFVMQDGPPAMVRVPSIEDIMADKLTAFAPATTGIPYEKGGNSRSMEIHKQLYDIGNLFEEISNLEVIEKTFHSIAKTQLEYRGLSFDTNAVIEDIIQTSLHLSTRGKAGKGDFEALLSGVSQIRPYIFSEQYQIEKAIVHASRAAYIAKLVESREKALNRFEDPMQIKDWEIDGHFDARLNKLKKTNPEAFFYWYQVYLLAKKQKPKIQGD